LSSNRIEGLDQEELVEHRLLTLRAKMFLCIRNVVDVGTLRCRNNKSPGTHPLWRFRAEAQIQKATNPLYAFLWAALAVCLSKAYSDMNVSAHRDGIWIFDPFGAPSEIWNREGHMEVGLARGGSRKRFLWHGVSVPRKQRRKQ